MTITRIGATGIGVSIASGSRLDGTVTLAVQSARISFDYVYEFAHPNDAVAALSLAFGYLKRELADMTAAATLR